MKYPLNKNESVVIKPIENFKKIGRYSYNHIRENELALHIKNKKEKQVALDLKTIKEFNQYIRNNYNKTNYKIKNHKAITITTSSEYIDKDIPCTYCNEKHPQKNQSHYLILKCQGGMMSDKLFIYDSCIKKLIKDIENIPPKYHAQSTIKNI